MNKSQLVEAVAKETKLTKKDTEATVNAFIKVVEKELSKKNGKVQLIGFGTFETTLRFPLPPHLYSRLVRLSRTLSTSSF